MEHAWLDCQIQLIGNAEERRSWGVLIRIESDPTPLRVPETAVAYDITQFYAERVWGTDPQAVADTAQTGYGYLRCSRTAGVTRRGMQRVSFDLTGSELAAVRTVAESQLWPAEDIRTRLSA